VSQGVKRRQNRINLKKKNRQRDWVPCPGIYFPEKIGTAKK